MWAQMVSFLGIEVDVVELPVRFLGGCVFASYERDHLSRAKGSGILGMPPRNSPHTKLNVAGHQRLYHLFNVS